MCRFASMCINLCACVCACVLYVCVLSASMLFTDVLSLSGSGVSLFQKQHSHKLMWHFEPPPHQATNPPPFTQTHAHTHTHTPPNQPPVKGRFHQSRFLSASQLSQLYSAGQGRFGAATACVWVFAYVCEGAVTHGWHHHPVCHLFPCLTSLCSLPCG